MQENRSFKGLIIGAVVIILALAGLVVFALSNQQQAVENEVGQTPTSSNETTSPTESNEAAMSETATITFTDNGFEPNRLTVKKGTVITVRNDSSTDIQFSSDDHPAHRDNTEMNMRVLTRGESASYTATGVGTWGFHNHLDESETGTVMVTE